ncbi:class I SAM-dependent methyltransferase [Yoonia sp.]|uniref:class I SAM-dependent methyltransferase n=1 Tax=Yoonia sp. TaxID=2212373 RepID=UPI00391C0817
MTDSSPCPVCATMAEHFLTVDMRAYFRCAHCQARFLDPAMCPAKCDEYAHYLHHENDPDDPDYRRFLSKLADPLLAELAPGSHGLDYGCGPGPALAHMLREAGHDVALYDPFFAPEPAPLDDSYDFVTCTEVAEHFHDPREDFARLRDMIRAGGILAIITCFQDDDTHFADWHYRKDPTHVVFFRAHTFRYLAAQWGWQITIPAKDVVLLRRPTDTD